MENNTKIPRKIIETSPYLNQLYNQVLSKQGSLKFLDVNQDISFLTEDDYLIYYGIEGETMAKELSNLGYNFKIMHIKEVSQNRKI